MFVANMILFPFLVKKKPKDDVNDVLQLTSMFIDLFDSSNEDETLPSSLKNVSMPSALPLVYHVSILVIDFIIFKTSHLSIIVDCVNVISLALNVSNKLKTLNYDTMIIQKVLCFLTRFNSGIPFEFPPLGQPKTFQTNVGHVRKRDNHAWCKVKTTNIKYDFSLGFHSSRCLGHLQCQNDCSVEFVFFSILE